MQSFSKREKFLICFIIFCMLLVCFLIYDKIEWNTTVSIPAPDSLSESKSIEDSIFNANIIFLCVPKIEGKLAKYKINKIIHKDENYIFPYSVGELYPRLERKMKKGYFYKHEQIVMLSTNSNKPFRSLTLMDDIIPGFNSLSLHDFYQTVCRLLHSLKLDSQKFP